MSPRAPGHILSLELPSAPQLSCGLGLCWESLPGVGRDCGQINQLMQPEQPGPGCVPSALGGQGVSQPGVTPGESYSSHPSAADPAPASCHAGDPTAQVTPELR